VTPMRSGNATDLLASEARRSVASEVDDLRLRVPGIFSDEVTRTRLIPRLTDSEGARLAVVVAPAGFGKTSLLRQWVLDEKRPVAWVTCAPVDADPVVLLRAVAVALDRMQRLPDEVFVALDGSLTAAPDGLRALCSALIDSPSPFALVFDDCHHLTSAEMSTCILNLVQAAPSGSLVALAGRTAPEISLGRLRIQGELMEIGLEELTLDRSEASTLLDNAGLKLSAEEVDDLYTHTQGWATGLRLAAIGARSTGPDNLRNDTESNSLPDVGDRWLAEYLAEEVLPTIEPDLLAFLKEASILDYPSGEACDEVLERSGCGELLNRTAQSGGLFLASVDQQRDRYQFHPFFAGALRLELKRTDPDRFRHLQTKASGWTERHGEVDAAVTHAVAAEDRYRTGDLILAHATEEAERGRRESIGVWLSRLDPAWMPEVPALALATGIYSALVGDTATLDLAIESARRLPDPGRMADGTPSLAVGIAMVTALAGRFRIEEMHTYTDVVIGAGRPDNPWYALASGLQGAADIQMRQFEVGRKRIEEVLEDVRATPHWYVLGLANLALADLEVEDLDAAKARMRDAIAVIERKKLENLPILVLAWVAAALVEARDGKFDRAAYFAEAGRIRLELFGDMRGFATRLQVLAPACLAETYLLMGDVDRARDHCRLAGEARVLEPEAALAIGYLEHARRVLDRINAELPGGITLTVAERRVLDLLPTHQTMQEMAEHLYVSRNTVKTHALTLYRKLGVSSRSDAVNRARELHVLPAE
jgi:LuxR family transcriptional regulator, maltose regulon positive regulatory protein